MYNTNIIVFYLRQNYTIERQEVETNMSNNYLLMYFGELHDAQTIITATNSKQSNFKLS